MWKIKRTIMIAVLFVSLFVSIVNIPHNGKADTQGDWIEELIRDVPTSARAVALGDVDLDGENEVVVGLENTTYEVRMYKKTNGLWKETLIADTPVGVSDLVVGDADDDGASEIVCTLTSPANQVMMYEYVSGSWVEETITTAPVQIYSVALGDADNDGSNEVVIGMANTTNDLRAYRRLGIWVEENITDVDYDVARLAIGDADNDGANEVVIGLDGNFPLPPPVYIPNEVRTYEKSGIIWVEDNITDTIDDDILSIVIGDCDEDGKNEVCVSCADFFTRSEFHTYENKSGTWALELKYPAAPNTMLWVGGVGDTDNDGKNELIILGASGFGSGQSQISVWENISNVFYGDMVASNLPGRPYTVIGDGDNDGVNEII
ncbi:MAG: hypothetical protein JSW28_06025, partial [Thermoplasmata archaeon]